MSCRFTPQLSVNDQLESGKQPVRLQWLFEQMLSSKWPLILQTCWWIKDHQIQWYSIVLRLSRNRILPCSGLTVSGKKSYSSCNASHFIFFPYRFIVCISSVKNPNGIYHTWVCCQKKKVSLWVLQHNSEGMERTRKWESILKCLKWHTADNQLFSQKIPFEIIRVSKKCHEV